MSRKDLVEDLYPLSPTQQGLLFHALYAPRSGQYIEQLSCTLRGELDRDAFQGAWERVVQRHPALRTVFLWEKRDEPVQLVYRRVRLRWREEDWRGLPAAEREALFQALVEEEQALGFDLTRPPLMRFSLLRIEEGAWRFLWTHHHLLLDGWSLPMVVQEVFRAYAALVRREEPALPPARPYSAFVDWLARQDLGEAERYWSGGRGALAGFREPTRLGVDRPAEGSGFEEAWVELEIGPLQDFARRHRLTLGTMIQGAWAALLARWSGEEDVLFGLTVSGRPSDLPGVESIVGLFINTLPARVAVPESAPLVSWLTSLQERQSEMQRFSHTPLADARRWSEVPRGTPLFETILVVENYPVSMASGRSDAGGLAVEDVRAAERTHYPVTVTAIPGRTLRLSLSWDRSRIDGSTARRLLDHLAALLEALPQDPERRVGDLPLPAAPDWNPPPVDWPGEASVHELFLERARQAPDAVAVVHGEERVTYAELARAVARVAGALLAAGVGPEDRVGLLLERSPRAVAAVLGTLQAGAAYVPLDPAYGARRLSLLLEDAAPRILITEGRLADGLPLPETVIDLNADFDTGLRFSSEEIAKLAPVGLEGDGGLAYVIYTSGSTGRPKGVMVGHRSLANAYFAWAAAHRLPEEARVHLQTASLAFDVFTGDLVRALASGGRLVIVPRELLASPPDLLALIRREGVEAADLVPALVRPLMDRLEEEGSDLGGLRLLVVGSDVWYGRELDRLRGLKGPRTRILSAYGLTEATVDSAFFEPGEDPVVADAPVPLGRPFANTRLRVVGPDLRPMPPGVAGELVIGGRGLARGYLNRPDLTAERFVPDPEGGSGARLYRTGDLARQREDGIVELLGRVDHQVKIRGYRVEPAEVEAVLGEHPGVARCVVVARRDGAENRLVAYVVSQDRLDPANLRAFLAARLPEFLVPAAFVALPELPLTPNGKVDRRSLPAPELPTTAETAAPRDELEAELARIWAEVLRVERVGVHDDFFGLGGDSILSIQIVSRANRAGMTLTPRQVFDHPTVAGLAAAIRASHPEAPAVELAPSAGPVPLTPIQRWFFDLAPADPHHWNQAVLLRSAQALDPVRLEAAVRRLVARHDALRLRFKDGAQTVAADGGSPFELIGTGDVTEAAARLQSSLDLERGPVCRFALLRQDRFLAIVHHLAVDAVSWGILLADLEALYAGAEPPPPTTPFAAWAERLASVVPEEADLWLSAPARVPPLPVDDPSADSTVGSVRTVSATLGEDETRELLQATRGALRARADEILLAALGRTLRRWIGAGPVLVDLEGHGREEGLVPGADLSRTVGWFTSMFPVWLEGEGLAEVKERLRALPRRGVGYGLLRWSPGETAARLAALPRAQVSFNYLGQVDRALAEDSAFRPAPESPGPLLSPRGRRSHLLDVIALVSGGRLKVDWSYAEGVHRRETVQALADGFLAALRELLAGDEPALVPSDFPLARLDVAGLARVASASVEDVYPLSPMQEGMLFHSLYAPQGGMYVEHLAFTIEGALDLAAFRAAWQAALDRHTALRSDFVWEGLPEPLQVVRRRVEMPWRELDWSGLAPDEQARRREGLIAEDRRQGFDLTHAPLMRMASVRLGDDRHGFVWCHHHLLLDGWSLPLLLGDVLHGYQGASPGEAPRPYRDYIAWLRSRDLAAEPGFWREALRGLGGPTPLGIDSAPLEDGAPELAERRVRLSGESTVALQDFARRHRLTLNTLLQGAWAVLLGRYSGEEEVLYGCTVSGRPAELSGSETMVGLFINTLPVRARMTAAQPVAAWLSSLQALLADLRQHEHAPLVEIQRWAGWPAGRPLFESVFVFENYPGGEPAPLAGGARVVEVSSAEGTNFPLTLAAAPGPRLDLTVSYDRRRFDEPAVARLLGHLETLLAGMAADPDRAVDELPVLSEPERAALVLEWNDTAADLGPDVCAHALFEEQARLRPDAPAVEMGDRVLTYRELDDLAESIAERLRAQGVQPGSRVALHAERSPETVANLLGILKAGGAFVPLDPQYPQDRLDFMLADSTGSASAPSEKGLAPVGTGGRPGPDDLAYVIYTSGSTGRPKGVALAHRGLTNLVRYQARLFGLGPGDRSLQFSSLSFDASVWEIVPALGLGATLVLAPAGTLPGPALSGLLREKAVTFATLTPSTLAAMPEEELPALRTLVAAAEALTPELVERWGRGRRLFNGYGPTESTVCATLARCRPGEGRPPLGRPIPNLRVHLLDPLGRLAPPGAPGEIAIGGVGLARGYLNRPDLTAERFVPDPFDPLGEGGRLYRTGDLGRQRPDGAFEFLGRIDHQFKVRGHRVEAGEVEAALALHPEVREAAVTLWRRTTDDQRLVAHVSLRSDVPGPELIAFLRERLPAHMVPAHVVVLPELPRLPNGKLDRRSLPAPGAQAAGARSAPPRTPLEEEIAAVWRDVLGRESVGVEDNFFDLGGHSLLAVRVHGRLRALGHDLEVVDLFHHPTVAALAEHLGGGRAEKRTVRRPRPAPRDRGEAPDIAIVGLSCRFPGAPDPEAFWRNLRDGVESISFFSGEELRAAGVHPSMMADPAYVPAKAVLDGVDRFDAAFFNVNPREAERMDPQHRVFLEVCWEALESAGCDPSQSSGRYPGAIGVFAGETLSTYLFHLASRLGAEVGGMQTMIGLDREFLTTTVSYKLDLRGPSLTLQTACSTSLVAVAVACQSLRAYECDMALAGGISIRVPSRRGYLFQEGGIESPDGHCRPFDADARGTVGGDGAGVVLLKRLEDALRDGDPVRAVIRGWALNNDGSGKVGFTAPSVEGQAEAIAAAQDMAGVDPDTITFVEGHGTATPLGDPIEVAALTKVFRESTDRRGFCALGAVKSNFGHLDAAAGVAGLIKTVLALEHREIPPTVHFRRPNPETKLETSPFFVNSAVLPWEPAGPRRAGVSSFGLGGTNAHVVLEEAPSLPAAPPPVRPWQLLVLSARSEAALDAAGRNLAAHLRAHSDLDPADVAWTLQAGRRAFRHRRAVVCRDLAGAAAALEAPAAAREAGGTVSVAFLFSGQGSQHAGMGRGLYETEPVFRRELDRCSEILGLDLREALEDGERLRGTALAQPALFAFEHALARQWMEWGVQPAAMLGHSVGEYVAACLAGVMTLEDALALVALRGRLMGGLPPGAMLAVPLPEAEVLSFLGEGLSLAAVNEPGRCVVSGTVEAVEALEAALAGRGLSGRRLHTSHAFHSAMMEPVLDRFAAEVAKVPLSAPRLPYLSNVTGTWITAEEATDPAYWARHLRQTVRFADGIAELLRTPGRVLLEVGPGSALAATAKRQISGARGVEVVASCRRPGEEAEDGAVLLGATGRLWMAGVDLDWGRLHEGERRRRVPLPTYPFERRRYWVDAAGETDAEAARPVRTRLAMDVADWFHVPVWRQRAHELRPADSARAAGPWLVLADPGGLGDRLAAWLREAGAQVTVAPWRTPDLDALLALPEDTAPRRIVHLGSLDPATVSGGMGGDPWEGLEASFFSLLHLAQALGRRSGPVELIAVTSGAFAVTGGEDLKPLQAAVTGVCKALPREVEGVSCRVLDVTEPVRLDRLVAELSDEAPPAPVSALRGSQGWVRGFDPVRLPAAPSRLRQGGVYLLTGGLGGIALALAERLARDWRAKLVLVGRAPLREDGADERTARRTAAVRNLETLGAEVLVLAADVTDREAMLDVRERAQARFGRIDGVFHAAGVASGGLLQTRPREDAARVLAPKVAGALVLDELFPGLDFMVLFSSMASLLAGGGQGDYAAANAFLDSFAQARNARGAFTVAVNWDAWQDMGMAAETGPDLDDALPSAQGLEAMVRLLAGSWPQIAVSRRHVQSWIEESHAARFGKELLEIEVKARPAHARPTLSSAYVEPRTASEQCVAAIWSELLGVDRVGALDDFFELGGDSLLGIQVITRLRQTLGVELPLRAMLEASTVARLAELVGAPAVSSAGAVPQDPGRLVTIQPGKGRVPLFLVHPAGGHVLGYRPLAERLGADRPVYGLEARGTQPGESPCRTIEEMAAEHVAAVTALRPHGPYTLGGASMGGTVAWEMARQIRDRGERVDLVALFDTPGPGQMPRELRDDAEILAYLGGARLGLTDEDLRRLPPEERLPHALERAAAAGMLPPGVDLERAATLVELFRVHVQAMLSYRPGPYAGRVVFFRAADRRPVDPPYPEVGWIGLAEEGAEVHVVPGDHGTMYLPPHVDTLAGRLRRCLEDHE